MADQLPDLGSITPELQRYKNALRSAMPGWLGWQSGPTIDTGPVTVRLGKNAMHLTPEQVRLLGAVIDARARLGYDGSASLDASAPLLGGRLSFSGQHGQDRNNSFRLQYERKF